MQRALQAAAATAAVVCMCSAASAAAADCGASDARILAARYAACASLVQPGNSTPWCLYPANVTAAEDWPSQAVYFDEVLAALAAAPAGCLATPAAEDTAEWLDTSQAQAGVSGSFAWTWQVFQPDYYVTPRPPGSRLESPDTLGRKCWAFAYLAQIGAATLTAAQAALAAAGEPPLPAFAANFTASVAPTLQLCDRAIANCFLNTTYDPGHNGTCPGDVLLFELGFERENLLRGGIVRFPFWT